MTTLVLSPYSAGGAPAMTSIDRKRILRVVPQSMEEAIRVGSNSRSRQRYQRTHRRRLAFQRQLVEQVLVHVGVKRRIVLPQVSALCFHGHSRGRSRDLEFDGKADRHRRARFHIL